MKTNRPKLKLRICKKLNDIDPSTIAPEKHKAVNEFIKKIKFPE